MAICLSVRPSVFLSYAGVYSDKKEDYWFGLHKETPSAGGTTYWLDGNPSTYRWWGGGEPNQAVACIRYTSTGFKDRQCSREYLFTCKMLASKRH